MPNQFESRHQDKWLTLLSVAFLLTLTAGCGDANRKKLVGTWTLDQSSRLEERIDSSDISDASKMNLEFRGGGYLQTTTKMGGIDGRKQGSWEFVSFDEIENTMEIKCILGMQTTEHSVEFLADDRIKIDPPNMAGLSMKLEFQRD